MESIAQSLKSLLPKQEKKVFAPVGKCIYCGRSEDLSDEHIIPFGLGGRLELPDASCLKCNKITSAFELTCLRTMYGPLRLLYDLPSRRKKKRPKTLPLKVKINPQDDWEFMEIEQEKYPFLVGFPYFSLPTSLSPGLDPESKGPTTKRIWIRGASPSYVFKDLLQQLTEELHVHSVMPEATTQTTEFCQMIAKIAHSFAVAELGVDGFTPTLVPAIIEAKLDNRHEYIGSLPADEEPTSHLHEVSMVESMLGNLTTVRIRLLAKLGTPTYMVVVGNSRQTQC